MASDYPAEPQPHPYLHEPVLYITNLPSYVSDENLALAFQFCAPFRPVIARDDSGQPVSGTIQFKFLEKAEKALATLHNRPVPELQPPVILNLSPYPPTTPPTPLPPPSASPRLVKQLPPTYTDSLLYDLFRPFGALASAKTDAGFGIGTGVVEFWREEDARAAEEAMHCAEVEGQNIAVQVYQPRRTSGLQEFSANAPAFVPSGGAYYPNPQARDFSPQGRQYSPPSQRSPYLRPVSMFVHGPGQQVQPAAPGTSHSGLIDPCNLFCKNLDPELDSNSLFAHFRKFGQIVSARVMRNENGESRGFGFVSYQTPDQAAAAMHAMNGAVIGSKAMVVRLHEPKQLRQEKLAHRFGNGHPRTASGSTSPTASEMGEWAAQSPSYGGWGSPRSRAPSVLASPVMNQHIINDRPERVRRGSGSYYNAALSGTLNLPMQYDDLAALSPVVRKEVLTGDLSRRLKEMELVPADELSAIVDSLVGLSLSEVVQGIQNSEKLKDQVKTAQRTVFGKPATPSPPAKSPSPAASHDSRLLDANTLNATASAPEHPSTPVSVAASISTPPRTASPSGSVPPASERERMAQAVAKLEPTRQADLVELLMTLPKRDRAMCLFNSEILRQKIADAKMVLDSSDGEEETASATIPTPSTPQARKVSNMTNFSDESPKTPALSSRAPSAAASPAPATPSAPTTTYTIASLARLPAVEIIRLANSSSATGLPLPKADPLIVKSTDEFIDSLLDKPIQQQKQALGDKLWRVVKSFGIKGAPKLTITLLDQDDLRALAHLMNSYPAVLKEKALIIQQGVSAK
ncbi:hypothetical protein PUNSTDRAFT_52774 [Punctularia strigosozonata HHB-11173 SS5]|uniref:uncharacterized protein n=1 Tax=Punctularia strigosozonata (strain HHB-11173) TaxID=741275 RepID=UPI0004417B37|nr:uncharacterized protein PUNSTDRAFT_52774 [Punctularia strigosozonata HHB-11173 SS5]EIN08348.1 hypothetical protein PUNSTDRAFT_52774 [Punctularia strigosozonata HHB-11173 SS5]